MKIYMAAVFTNDFMPGQYNYREKMDDFERGIVCQVPHLLESYHYVKSKRWTEDLRRCGAKVFLDSGAYSAFTLGATLDLNDYVEYIKKNKDIILVEDGVLMASVLDGIGDPLQTYRNQLQMEEMGVRPLPCFHAGEDERYLEYYISNYDYITLGGMVGAHTKQLMIWLDRIWDKYLTDGSGRARCKVHGFGITSIPLMERYPWYSCDSSSWVQMTAFGAVLAPYPSNGTLGIVLNVSEKSPARHTAGHHVSNFTEEEQRIAIQMVEANGFDYSRLEWNYPSRAMYNLWSFGVINELINAEKSDVFVSETQELF